MPWENGRKRRHSDVLQDPYKGPQEFMEAGVRGFLVTSIPDREEHSIDEAVKVLRKSCIKLYGGIRPLNRGDASFAKGYVMVDFMDPEKVIPLPHPDADKVAAEEKEKQTEAAAEEGKEAEKMEEEVKEETEAEDKAEKEKAAPEEVKEEETKKEEPKEEEGTDSKANEEKGADSKTKEEKEKEEQKKKEELRRKRKEEEERAKPPLMLAPHKFQSFRTELRNIMFIKADVPDPVIVATTAFDLIMERKPLLTDCINQLLPVQGVCDNDYKQLEIMCRRVLVPYIGEHLEEAPSFGVLLVDKMSEPGSEVLLEAVRSAIWCLNPNAWQSSPWCEPDVVIHVEIIGSKIVLSAMSQYMKYRQYSPFACHEMGVGKPEDEENLLKDKSNEEKEKEKESHKPKDKDKGRKKKEKSSKDDSSKKKAEEEPKPEAKEDKKAEEKENTKEGEGEEKKESTEEAASEEKKSSSEGKKSTRSKSATEKKSKS